MPHADSAYVPDDITTKAQFYDHVTEQLEALLDGSRYWVSNLAQAASLLSNAYQSSPLYGFAQGSSHAPRVNWVGFYIHPPSPSSSSTSTSAPAPNTPTKPLLLGPYMGRPACITIQTQAGKGVCADAFVHARTVVVDDVEAYPGHIACDGDTRSEIVIPLHMHVRVPYPFGDGGESTNAAAVSSDGEGESMSDKRRSVAVGVLDLDSVEHGTFDEHDKAGLERVVQILQDACDWE